MRKRLALITIAVLGIVGGTTGSALGAIGHSPPSGGAPVGHPTCPGSGLGIACR